MSSPESLHMKYQLTCDSPLQFFGSQNRSFSHQPIEKAHISWSPWDPHWKTRETRLLPSKQLTVLALYGYLTLTIDHSLTPTSSNLGCLAVKSFYRAFQVDFQYLPSFHLRWFLLNLRSQIHFLHAVSRDLLDYHL